MRLPYGWPGKCEGEFNAYAAELARVSVWIGEIQWMRRNGFHESRDPILKPLETIECRDAILTPEGGELSTEIDSGGLCTTETAFGYFCPTGRRLGATNASPPVTER